MVHPKTYYYTEDPGWRIEQAVGQRKYTLIHWYASYYITYWGHGRLRQLFLVTWSPLCPCYRPFELLDAHLVSGLLIVVEPLPLCQVDLVKLGIGLEALGEPLSLWDELGKLQTPAVELDDLLLLGRLCLLIRGRGSLDRCR